MDISEIRVKLVRNSKERLKAVCSVTFDGDFVIRDLKVIDGATGLFVAMPSRKLADHCPKCRAKNHLRARFCNECGGRLDDRRADRVRGGRARLHADIAHPINSECRNRMQAEVVEAYEAELERSKQPDYRPASYDDFDDDDNDNGNGDGHGGSGYSDLVAELKKEASARRPRRDDRLVEYVSEDDETDGIVDSAEDEVDGEDDAVDERVAEPASTSSGTDEDGFGAGIL